MGACVYDLEVFSKHSRIPVLDWDKPQASLPSLDKRAECAELCNFGANSPYLQLCHPPLKHSSLQNESTHYNEIDLSSLQVSLVKLVGRTHPGMNADVARCQHRLVASGFPISVASNYIAWLQAIIIGTAFFSQP